MKGDILLVGGYGAVGRVIALALADKFPGQVVAAGRSYQKAEALAQVSGGKIRPYQFDLTTAHQTPELLDDVAVVVICLDIPDMQFVRQCLQQGVHYVDITAEDAILQQIEALDEVAKAGGSTAVLSVGLSPGLTNLLVRHAQSQFDSLQQVDIYGFLGLGEPHGPEATRWTLRRLNDSYTVRENGQPRQVGSFTEHKQVQFPDGIGERRVYRFNLADQHVVMRTLDVPSVSTWLTFDPPSTAQLMAFMRRSGLAKLLRYRWVEELIVKMSTAVYVGSEKFILQVEAQGNTDGRTQTQTYAVVGNGQSRATGLVAAQVVEQIYAAGFPPGVYHSEQLFAPMPFIHQLAGEEIAYHETGTRHKSS
ncbi:MAG TPA: saccharopine dehydrogenase [Anaerolineae bacterium]|nr:saccharopine dehydrogenase [Anaerolineae bacterium]